MGKMSLIDRIRRAIGSLGFRLFLWANKMTQEEYFKELKFELNIPNLEKQAEKTDI